MDSTFQTRESLVNFIKENSNLKALLEEVTKKLDGDPAHDLAHFIRVALWTIKFGEQNFDPRLAIASALLHDIVNVPKNSPLRSKASELSADKAKKLLPKFFFTESEIILISDAIRDHSFSRGAVPQSFLGKCLQDADRLESLGALGIMRTFSTGVLLKAQYFHPEDPWARHRERDDSAFSVDHFFLKLLKLPELMNTPAGKMEALKRAQTMTQFLNDLGSELGQPII